MDKKLYLDCGSGISGDMFVAAMIDLGADLDALGKALDSIPADGFFVNIDRVKKSGISCCDFDVILDEEHENHDHDMEYLFGSAAMAMEHHCHCHEDGEEYGHCHEEGEHHCHCHEDGEEHGHCDEEEEHHCHCHEEGEEHGHCHEEGEHHCHCHEDGEEHGHCHEEGGHHCHCHEDGEEHGHCHEEGGHHCHCHEEGEEHGHCHEEGEHHCHCHEEGEEHGHHHEHRGLKEIFPMIDACDMTDSAKALAHKMFQIIGEAEAEAHDLPIEEVHFHEVGALDSIVDVIAAAVTFDSLGVKEVIIPKLTEGTGTVRCQHGVMPVPVPATVNIISAYHIPMEITGAKGEYVTPTGAAIAAAITTSHRLPPSFVIKKTGLGGGKREYADRSNILRAFLIETEENDDRDEVVKLETDIDDCSGEVLGYVMKKLFKAGAKDVHYAPIFMKKNRPAWELTVICKEDQVEELEKIIFTETTTIGIREYPLMRSILERKEKEVETVYGKAAVKQVTFGDMTRSYPEYDTVKKLAKKNKVPFADVFDAVKEAAKKK